MPKTCRTYSLPPRNDFYLVNSGAETIESALKLAKHHTGSEEIITCRTAYHGNTHNAMILVGNESYKRAFRPLLPRIRFTRFNDKKDPSVFTEKTAHIVLETIQVATDFILLQIIISKRLKDNAKKPVP
ncbi:MAG: aminotransferase class III-fold pyridoxal phosphate-dependent enzyme [Flavobacteriales bacterium]